jgi:sialic acid synthase SpsE
VELVAPANSLPWDAYKTASPDVVNKPLIDALMATGRPLLVSCGASTLDEVAQASRWIGDHPHVLMQCVSAYPTTDEDAALAGRCAMRCVDPCALGYSDHTTALDTGALAVASGARVLEKHLTYDRSARGPDHAASLDAAGFAEYVRLAHRAFAMLGPREKRVLNVEEDVRQVSRQSVTSTRALLAGHVLTRADLTIKRPGTGLPPWTLERVFGRRLMRAVEADMPLVEADVE